MKMAGAILAGGKSSRMGENKALMQLGDRRVIEHITEEMKQLGGPVLLVANEHTAFDFLGLPIIADRYKEKGPLGGMEAALSGSPDGYVAFAACDTPFLSAAVYQYLRTRADGKQAVIPSYQGRIHPLSGIYHTNILPYVRKCLEKNDLKMKLLLSEIDYHLEASFAGLPELVLDRHFFNMNNQQEYVQALNFMEK